VSSIAQTLLSTQPVGSSSARSTSSVMSVGTPLDFFGHATQMPPSGAAAFVSFGHAAASFDRDVKKATTTSSGANRDLCQMASPKSPSVSAKSGGGSTMTNTASSMMPSFLGNGVPE